MDYLNISLYLVCVVVQLNDHRNSRLRITFGEEEAAIDRDIEIVSSRITQVTHSSLPILRSYYMYLEKVLFQKFIIVIIIYIYIFTNA